MEETIQVALIAGGFAILGSIISGIFNLLSSRQQKKMESYRKNLTIAYSDIAAYHRLEEVYCAKLEDLTRDNDGKSAAAWKRRIRKELRDKGSDSPSGEATALKAERKIKMLD